MSDDSVMNNCLANSQNLLHNRGQHEVKNSWRCSPWERTMDLSFPGLGSVLDLFATVLGLIRVVHDDVIKWKHFPRYWSFVRGIHRSPVNSPRKSQWRGALMFSLMCVWIKSWINNRKAGDLRRYRARYDVIVMLSVREKTSLDLFPFPIYTDHNRYEIHFHRRKFSLN